MFRLVVICVVALCLSVNASPSPQGFNIGAFLGGDDSSDSNNSFGALAGIITNIKVQIKEILKELFVQVVDYIVKLAEQVKVKLIKKLGTYTLADILNFVCDFVTDLLVTPVTAEDYKRLPVRLQVQSQQRPQAMSLLSLLHSNSNSDDDEFY